MTVNKALSIINRLADRLRFNADEFGEYSMSYDDVVFTLQGIIDGCECLIVINLQSYDTRMFFDGVLVDTFQI